LPMNGTPQGVARSSPLDSPMASWMVRGAEYIQQSCTRKPVPIPEGAGCEVKIALSGSGFNQSRNMLSMGLTEHMFLGGRHLKDETT